MISRTFWLGVARGLFGLALAFAPVAASQSFDELRTATRREPNNIDNWINLGNYYLESGQYDEAQESFLEAVSIEYRSGDAHFGLGLAEFERGDFPAALFQFNEVSRLYPERFDGHFNRAVTLTKLRNHEEAVEAFNAAIENADEASSAERINAYLGLAGQLKRTENYEGAAEAYSAALELRPGDTELIFLRAESLYQAGMGLEALPELSNLETRISDYRVSSLIADIYVQSEQSDYAINSLERALRKAQAASDGRAQASILVNLGLLQRDLGREAEATSAFQRAVAADASSWEARYNLGVNYLEAGQPESALGYLQNAVSINPEFGEAYLALATAYDQLGRSNDAYQNAETALTHLAETDLTGQANFILGRGLYRQNDFEGALSIFEELTVAEPENAAAQLWSGLSEYGLENYDAAVQYIERAVQLDPESVEARINLGAAYLASERYQDAELVYQLLTEDNAQDADAYYNLGWALFAQERREAAKEAWVRASDLDHGPARDALQRYF